MITNFSKCSDDMTRDEMLLWFSNMRKKKFEDAIAEIANQTVAGVALGGCPTIGLSGIAHRAGQTGILGTLLQVGIGGAASIRRLKGSHGIVLVREIRSRSARI